MEDGWWSGTVNGKSGLFPSNFVEELEAAGEEPELNNTPANVTGNITFAKTAAQSNHERDRNR